MKAVGWSGGEFLVRKDAFDLLRLTADLGYQCKVCSNGELLSRERLQAIKDATGGKVTIALGLNSLDEDNAETRDADCDRTIEVLELCKELGIDRHVIVTIGKHNTDSFERTIDYLIRNRISFNRSPLVARGSGRDHFSEHAFERDDLEKSFHPVLRSHVNGYVSYTPFFLSPELYDRASGGMEDGIPHNPPIGCWVGNWITLTAEGDVSVCPVLLDALSAGNVREKPLDELVLSSKLFQEITDRSQLEGTLRRVPLPVHLRRLPGDGLVSLRRLHGRGSDLLLRAGDARDAERARGRDEPLVHQVPDGGAPRGLLLAQEAACKAGRRSVEDSRRTVRRDEEALGCFVPSSP